MEEMESALPYLNVVQQPLIFRLVSQQQHVTEFRVEQKISFHSLLNVLEDFMKACGEAKPNSFEYEDEDGDRITVRSDEELNAMIDWNQHCYNHMCNSTNGLYYMTIYPKVGKTATRRNTLGLTVDVNTPLHTNTNYSKTASHSSRKCSEGVETILSCENILQEDLQFLHVIGHGNGGTVHKAFHTALKKTLAVKVISLDITLEVQRQILSEMDILFQCNSPYIISFYGAFFTENKISMCTEYMDRSSLDNYGQIPSHVLAGIVVMIVKGLQYLLSLKIMHRDVKPSNILVNSKGQVKLCDFGVSIQLVNSIAKTYVGTNAYMAPERIMGDEYGIHSDVWSLGLSLIEMSTGMFPYPLTDSQHCIVPPIELLQYIVNEQPPSLSTELFDDTLREFVESCLKKNPKERPTPLELSQYRYILQNDTENLNALVADFVNGFKKKLPGEML
ncbi:dual specificity mitogen-activated protein kinase kinase 5 isoform X1 [Hydra vulgaris]|nr:dual specificity mitogen-activated protein kinase kinase 5 isoform X1 [Hydra vulgaris]